MSELAEAERDYQEKAQRASDLLAASRNAYDRAENAAANLRACQDAAAEVQAEMDWGNVFLEGAESLLDIETRTAFIAAGQHAAAATDAEAARARVKALRDTLPASDGAAGARGAEPAPSAGDALLALDEEN